MANNTSISNLSEVEEVNAGDFFIIDTPNGTQKIDFGNVLIPLDNATFNTTISAHATDITTNRTEIQTLTAALYDGGDTTLAVGSLSTQSLTAGAFNLTGNFDGDDSGSAVVRTSFNVSSLAERAVGKYTINFSTDMANANYVVAGVVGNADDGLSVTAIRVANSPAVGNVQINTSYEGSNAYDNDHNSVIIFGN